MTSIRAGAESCQAKQPEQVAPGEPVPFSPSSQQTTTSPESGQSFGSYRTHSGEELILRHCRGMDEFEACVELQRQTWGYPDLEMTPRKAFLLAQQLGGQVIGAFDSEQRLVGFAMAMAAFEASSPAIDPGLSGELAKPIAYLHSHMLAVLPAYRDQGLGTELKLAQREEALSRGIECMTWTFDPLAAKNAYLNLHRLGAIARRYSPDFYGVSSSRLQAGLPTDRLHAEWWLRSARVAVHVHALRQGVSPVPGPVEEVVPLPAALESWKQDPDQIARVRAVQDANRAIFSNAFARGLAIKDFSKDATGDGMYQLAMWQPSEDRL